MDSYQSWLMEHQSMVATSFFGAAASLALLYHLTCGTASVTLPRRPDGQQLTSKDLHGTSSVDLAPPSGDVAIFKKTVRILTVNDVYTDFADSRTGLGGYAGLRTLLKKYRINNHGMESLFILPGDFLGGSARGQAFQGRHTVEILNELQCDFLSLGNHEFDFGVDELKKRIQESRSHWLGSNVRETSTGNLFPGVKDTVCIDIELPFSSGNDEVAGTAPKKVKLGFFGVCTELTPKLSYPGPTVKFESTTTHAKRAVQQLKDEGADIIIAMTHMNIAQDKIIARIPGIDYVFGGHDHQLFALTEGNTFVIKCGQNAERLGVIDISIELQVTKDLSTAEISESLSHPYSFQMILNKRIKPDSVVVQIIEKYQELQAAKASDGRDLDEVLAAVVNNDLVSLTEVVRVEESGFGNALADAMVYYHRDHKPEFGIINGGFIRGNSVYPKAFKLTLYHVEQELPFPRPTVLVDIKGEDLVGALETALSALPAASGAFPHLSAGIKVEYDPSRESGNRITEILIGGLPVDPHREYRAVITSFMAMGGDNNLHFSHAKILKEDDKKICQVFVQYLRVMKEIDGGRQMRCVAVSR